MANKRISQIDSLPRKWVIKHINGFYVVPSLDDPNDYNLSLQIESDAFRYTEGEAIDFFAKFPKLKNIAKIIQVTI